MGLAGRSRSPLFFFCTRHTPRTRWHDALKRAAGIAPFCCCCCSACDLNCFGESVRPSGRRREVRGRPGGRAWTAADRNRQPQATHTEGGVEVDTDVKAVTSVCLRGVRAASASSTDAGRSARSGRPDHARSLPPLPPSPVEFASQTQTQTSAAQACCRCTSARDPVARPRCCSPRVTRLRFPDPTGSAVGDPLRPAAGVVRRAGPGARVVHVGLPLPASAAAGSRVAARERAHGASCCGPTARPAFSGWFAPRSGRPPSRTEQACGLRRDQQPGECRSSGR